MITLASKPVTATMMNSLQTRVKNVTAKLGRPPQLAVILVGDDPAAAIYTKRKSTRAAELGIAHQTVLFPSTASPQEVRKAVTKLNEDDDVDGILIQRPLPSSFKEEEVLYWVAPHKDVDAFHPENTGRLMLNLPCFAPCTPAGVMELLKAYEIPIAGKTACVIGRSSIVGKPMASLLLAANATLIHCHSKTRDLGKFTREADILVVAAGKPGLITGEHVKQDAVVVDVGIHQTAEGKVIGDVDFASAALKASAITPVPGGVGPMTIMMLMQNTVKSAELRA